jgi:hypothetical protein
MRMFSWLAVGLAAGGYLVFRKLLERDAQRLHEPKRLRVVRRSVLPEESEREVKSSGPPRKKGPAAGKTVSLDKKIVKQVREHPGLLQTELYGLFPAIGRKQLQDLLLRLGRQGVLQRKPEKGTYRLFPVVAE